MLPSVLNIPDTSGMGDPEKRPPPPMADQRTATRVEPCSGAQPCRVPRHAVPGRAHLAPRCRAILQASLQHGRDLLVQAQRDPPDHRFVRGGGQDPDRLVGSDLFHRTGLLQGLAQRTRIGLEHAVDHGPARRALRHGASEGEGDEAAQPQRDAQDHEAAAGEQEAGDEGDATGQNLHAAHREPARDRASGALVEPAESDGIGLEQRVEVTDRLVQPAERLAVEGGKRAGHRGQHGEEVPLGTRQRLPGLRPGREHLDRWSALVADDRGVDVVERDEAAARELQERRGHTPLPGGAVVDDGGQRRGQVRRRSGHQDRWRIEEEWVAALPAPSHIHKPDGAQQCDRCGAEGKQRVDDPRPVDAVPSLRCDGVVDGCDRVEHRGVEVARHGRWHEVGRDDARHLVFAEVRRLEAGTGVQAHLPVYQIRLQPQQDHEAVVEAAPAHAPFVHERARRRQVARLGRGWVDLDVDRDLRPAACLDLVDLASRGGPPSPRSALPGRRRRPAPGFGLGNGGPAADTERTSSRAPRAASGPATAALARRRRMRGG